MNFKFNVKLMKCPIKQKQTKQNKKKKKLLFIISQRTKTMLMLKLTVL